MNKSSHIPFEPSLFLGFLITSSLSKILTEVSPALKSVFIKNGGEYLEEVSLKGDLYLGKIIEKSIKLSEFNQLSLNIYSLLKKVVPDYPFEENELILLPFLDNIEIIDQKNLTE